MKTGRLANVLNLVAVGQGLLGLRVVWRLLRTSRGNRVECRDEAPPTGERVTVILPVLNERARLAPCLDGLIAQPPEVAEILVVDGGSIDGTPDLVDAYARRDRRIRLLNASPVPPGWNGKAHNLQTGLDHAHPETAWVLTIDADVRPEADLTRSLLAHSRRVGVAAFSAATRQRLSGPAEGLLHPSLLTTLVYRFGIPGGATRRVDQVQANGQCFLVRREALIAVGGFRAVRSSLCEDVTLARCLAAAGHTVGFYETDGLVSVAMYAGWRDAWRNWTRSLPMRDRFWGVSGPLGLAEVTLAQALPMPLSLLVATATPRRSPDGDDGARLARSINAALLAVRLGVLVGTARAYRDRPWTYWLSPVSDLPVALQLWRSAFAHRHVWRGRVIVRGAGQCGGIG